MHITGKCHCGNIAVDLEAEGGASEIRARACSCSFCTKHGGVWTSDPAWRVAVTIRDASLVSKYAFGTRTATFHVCARCGAVPVVTSEIANRLYAVVNVNVLDDVDRASLRRTQTNFEGEDADARLARRKRGWIANVRIEEPSVVATARLLLRRFRADDARFVFALVNDTSWLRFIGDKNVRTIEDARRYIETGPIDMYARLGFGLYLVALKETGEPVGMCGFVKRRELEDVDLGFAFLPQFRGKGYAVESAAAVVSHGRNVLGLARIVAICSPDNHASASVLAKLGFRREAPIRLHGDGEALDLYASPP